MSEFHFKLCIESRFMEILSKSSTTPTHHAILIGLLNPLRTNEGRFERVTNVIPNGISKVMQLGLTLLTKVLALFSRRMFVCPIHHRKCVPPPHERASPLPR